MICGVWHCNETLKWKLILKIRVFHLISKLIMACDFHCIRFMNMFNKCVKWHSKLHNFFASHVDHLSHIVKNFFLLVFAKLWQKTLKSFFSATSPSQNCCKQFYLANVYGSGFSKPTNVNQRLLTIDTVFVMLVWDKSNQIWQTKTFQEPSMTMIVVL